MAKPSNEKAPERRKRRWLRGLVVLGAVFMVALVLLAAALQTPFAKGRIARFIENNVSTAIIERVEIGEITGTIPFNFRIAKITLWDEGERWLVAHDIGVDVARRALLQRRMHVRNASVERIELLALPVGEESQDPWRLPEVPDLPRWLRIDRAAVGELAISDAIAAEAGRFTATAHFVPDSDTHDIDIQARVERVDAPTTRAEAVVILAEDALTLRVDASDSVFLPDLLRVSEPISIRLDGSGPLRAWDGTLLARLGDQALVEAEATLRADTGTEFDARGSVNLVPELVPEAVRERVGESLAFSVAGILADDGLLEMRSARVESARARIEFAGQTHLEQHTLAGRVTASYDDLRMLAPLRTEAAVPAAIAVDVDGTWTQQTWSLAGDVAGERSAVLEGRIAIETVLALDVSGELTVPKALVAEEHWNLAEEPVLVSVDARYNQETGAVSVPEFRLGNPWANAEGRLAANPGERTIDARIQAQLTDSTLLNDVLAVDFSGTGSAELQIDDTDAGTHAVLRADLDDLRVGEVHVARVTAAGDVRAGAWPDQLLHNLSGGLEARTSRIRIGERDLPALVFAVDAEQDEGGPIRITQVRVSDERFVVAGAGTIADDGARAELELDITVPELGPYTAIADQPYDGAIEATAAIDYDRDRAESTRFELETTYRNAGGFPGALAELLTPSVQLTANGGYDGERVTLAAAKVDGRNWRIDADGHYALETQAFDARAAVDLTELNAAGVGASGAARLSASGSLENFNANADLALTDLAAGGARMDRVTGAVLASGSLDDLQVTADLTAETAGEQLNATTLARYAGPVVDVEQFAVRSGENAVDGRLAWNLDDGTGRGTLELNLPELEQIGRVVGEDLAGRVNGQLALDASSVTADLVAENVVSRFASLDEARVTGNVRDVFAEPRGRIEADVEALRAGVVAANLLTLAVAFEGETVRAELETGGLVQETIPFDTTAQATWNIDAARGSVEALYGSLEEYAYALRSPAQIRVDDEGVVLEPAALEFGGGLIEFGGRTGETLAMDVQWSAVPLAAGQLAGLPFTEGTIAGRANLRGAADAPSGAAAIEIANARTPAMAEQRNFAANMRVESELSPQSLTLTASIDVPQSTSVELNAALPLMRSDETVYALNERAPLSARVTVDADLASIPRLLALDGHVMAGQATADITAGGSVSDPVLTGGVFITSGRYENAEFGTILRRMEMEMRATNDRVDLVRFRAEDPRGGSLTAEGGIGFSNLMLFDHRFSLRVSDARLVHRDDLTGRVDGRLTLSGDQDGSEVAGRIDVIEANVILRPAPDYTIPELEVAMLNAPPSYTEAAPESSPRNPFENHPIRLNVDVAMPGRVFVQAVDVFTEWQGDIRVTGTVNEPYLTGQIAPVRGHISFLGQRFMLQPASTVQIDTRETEDPLLNLIAVATRDNLEATLFVRGPLSAMSIELTSNPVLPQEEILARVLFGRDMTQISPVQALQLARAVAMLSGTLEGVPFFSGPSRLPVIDTFDVETGGEGGPTVSVGKYLSEDIFVELEQGAGVETGRASVQFELTPQISVETSVGADTEGGVGIFWKYDY